MLLESTMGIWVDNSLYGIFMIKRGDDDETFMHAYVIFKGHAERVLHWNIKLMIKKDNKDMKESWYLNEAKCVKRVV